MISCVILSAGLSERFGSPKALARIKGIPNILFLIDKLSATQVAEIIVVLGADKDKIEPLLFKHRNIRVVYNNDYKLGQLSSIQKGIQSVSNDASGAMILPIDCPFVSAKSIDALINHFLETPSHLLIPTHNGRRGHPPIIHATLKDKILRMNHQQSFVQVIRDPDYRAGILELPDIGIIQTFNTVEELRQIELSVSSSE